MICGSCLRRASARRALFPITRSFTSTQIQFTPGNASISSSPQAAAPAANSSGPTPSFSTPLSSSPSDGSRAGSTLRHKAAALPISSAPAGKPLKGINYLKGRDDPVALPEEDYPEWLWKCLDGIKADDADGDVGDEFSKSKKVRRKAAKRERKLQARLLASGDTEALAPKIPLQQQSIDLPFNKDGSLQGGLEAMEKRDDLKKAMRKERRASIKESNFLKAM